MRPDSALWFDKAQEDYLAAEWLLKEDSPVVLPAVFHIQQCAEKLLKGYLTEKLIEFEKKHDLTYLLTLSPCDSLLEFNDFLEELSPFAVEIRYPGDFHPIHRDEGNEFFFKLKGFREAIMRAL